MADTTKTTVALGQASREVGAAADALRDAAWFVKPIYRDNLCPEILVLKEKCDELQRRLEDIAGWLMEQRDG